MSKIICDVCGTSYPDTATQCPICGCVRSADVEAVVTSEEATETVVGSTYTYVKGGRFSKANVKKRNSGKPVAAAAPKSTAAAPKTAAKPAPAPARATAPTKPSSGTSGQKSNLGLIIVIVVLLLAIVAVLSYITIRFVIPGVFGDDAGSNVSEYVPIQDDDTDKNTEPTDPDISCTALNLSHYEYTMSSVGETFTLEVTPDPVDTTDKILFDSDDDSIATVDTEGVITAVADGETIVTVTCGTQSEMCLVICNISAEGADGELVLDAETYTLTQKGETWTCYTGTIPVEEITWISDDEAVATVANGVVTAVGAGTTTIRAQYNETEMVCEIICEDSVNTTTDDNTGDEQTSTATGNYKFNTNDDNEMMLVRAVDPTYSLRLRDEKGKNLSGVKYSSSNESVCTVTENGNITGIAAGTVIIKAEYNGEVYECKVYVR